MASRILTVAAAGALAIVFASNLPAAEAHRLTTADQLSIEFSGGGAVTGLSTPDRAVPLRESGGFYLIDYKNQPAAANLVSNPGFENGKAGWSFLTTQALDTEVVHSGGAAVRLHVSGPKKSNSNLGVLVPVKPGHRYRVGIWVRRRNCGVCGVYVSERDSAGKLAGKVTQQGLLGIPQQDDVWQLASREVEVGTNTTQLSLRADIYRSTGTVWLDDFFIHELPEPVAERVTGQVTTEGTGLTFTGKAANCELRCSIESKESTFAFRGSLKDLTGQDRAIGMSFRLPFDAAGWTWFDDHVEKRPVDSPVRYRRTYKCKTGDGICSVYPWSALTTGDMGLSLALPLSQGPRVFVIAYDNENHAYQITFYFGLSRDLTRSPSAAEFAFLLFRHDPAWGMRSAIEKYYELYPESFLKRPVYEGYLNYANLERPDPKTHRLLVRGKRPVEDCSDFGEGYDFIWHLHGCYWFHMFFTEDSSKPSDEVVMAFLRDLVQKEGEKGHYYCAAAEGIKKLVHDADGHISYISDTRYWKPHEGYNHHDKPGWGLNFHVNEDPEMSDELARKSRDRVEKYLAKHPGYAPFSACLTADAIEGYHTSSRRPDYRREHFRTTLLPLTFGNGNLKPCMPNTIWDFHQKEWWPYTQEHKIVIYGNANCYEQGFVLPYVDIPMIEFDWDRNHPGRLERYCRALAGKKIWRWWRTCGKGEQDEKSVLLHFDRGLAYAIYPAVYPLVTTSGNLDKYRRHFRQYVPAIEALSRAGWEPVPHARVQPLEVAIERYGRRADGNLHFTLRNYGDEELEVAIVLDCVALGIGERERAELLAFDLLNGLHEAARISPEAWRVHVCAKGARALWVGTRKELARNGLANAAYDLGRLERLFASDLDAAARKRIEACRDALSRAQPGDLGAKCAAVERVHSLAAELPGMVKTKAGVDLAKVLFRLKTGVSAAGLAASGLRCGAPRVVGSVAGEPAKVTLALANSGSQAIGGLQVRVLSPWDRAGEACEVRKNVTSLPAGGRAEVDIVLRAPVTPERRLLPYLLEITGTIGGNKATIDVPVDVCLRSGLALETGRIRVCRGRSNQINLTLRNSTDRAMKGELAFGKVRGVTFQPAHLPFSVPAGGAVTVSVAMDVAASVQLGGLLVPYSIEGDNAAVRQTGQTFAVHVTIPVPRTEIRRPAAAITVDGRLEEAVWHSPPTIPELRFIRDGKKPTEKSEVWITYDDNGLYVAFRCHESNLPGITAQYTNRGDPLYRDDDIEFFLLPPGDVASLQFAVNPLGTQSDNFGNKAAWRAAASGGDAAWTVEAFVPYSVLGIEKVPSPGFVLTGQFGRQQKPKHETTAWTETKSFRDPDRFGDLVFR